MNPNESASIVTMAQILSLFSTSREEIGVREVSHTLSISPSKVHRLLKSLDGCGFLEKNVRHKYRLGEKIFSIGSLYPLHLPLRKIVRPHLEEFAETMTDIEEVQLGILSKQRPSSVIILDRITNLSSVNSNNRIVLNLSFHSTALGKVFLAFMKPEELEQVMKEIFFKRFTTNTIADEESLLLELKKIREKEIAWDNQETHYDVICAATPLFKERVCVGAVGLKATSVNMTKQKMEKAADELRERARSISRQL